jgi:two-component system chemotaxis response regulator CheB
VYGSEHRRVPVATTSGIVILAASFGGLRAIRAVLAALPVAFPLPIVVMLHRASAEVDDPLPRILTRSCLLPVRMGTDAGKLAAGTVTVLPAGREAGLADDGTLRLSPVGGQRLSADTLMRDAANYHGASAVAVVLTGKLADGADGARAIKRAGGMVIVQDPQDCAAPGMPTAALATGCVDHPLPLPIIGPMLIAIAMAPGAADLLRVPMAPWASAS